MHDILGRFSSGADAAKMVRSPVSDPALPIPAIALPTMSISEVFATAHIRDPSSNNASAIKKQYWDSYQIKAVRHGVRRTFEL